LHEKINLLFSFSIHVGFMFFSYNLALFRKRLKQIADKVKGEGRSLKFEGRSLKFEV